MIGYSSENWRSAAGRITPQKVAAIPRVIASNYGERLAAGPAPDAMHPATDVPTATERRSERKSDTRPPDINQRFAGDFPEESTRKSFASPSGESLISSRRLVHGSKLSATQVHG